MPMSPELGRRRAVHTQEGEARRIAGLQKSSPGLWEPGGFFSRRSSLAGTTRVVGPGWGQKKKDEEAAEQRKSQQQSQNFLMNYYQQVQQQQTAARTANEQRYQQMLGIADKDREAQLGSFGAERRLINRETGQRAADIRSETEGLVSQEQQRMSRLGLSNVSQPSVYAGIRREGQSNLNRLTDAFLGRKLDVTRRIGQLGRGKRLGIMERRTDAYPQTAGMTDLIKTIYQGFGTGAGAGAGVV